MAICKGDVVVDMVYLGEGYIDQKATGIVVSVESNKALVYWFDRIPIWGIQHEYETFDLSNETDVLSLNTMKEEYFRHNT